MLVVVLSDFEEDDDTTDVVFGLTHPPRTSNGAGPGRFFGGSKIFRASDIFGGLGFFSLVDEFRVVSGALSVR